jgi:anaerobic C4-dicarboxylate transporter
LVFRWPLGFFEPYVALGPAYRIELINGDPALPEVIPYGARVGFDFNITPVLALGIEGKHLIPNLPDLVGTSATGFDLTGDTHVGLVVKAKL